MPMRNPFEYDAAPNLDPDRLIDWYIEDHNYSRFMDSRRNVIINGERGSGKSMTLIYHSFMYASRAKRETQESPSRGPIIGIYVACNTPLSSKEEHKLLPPVAQMRVAEANLTLAAVTNLAREFSAVSDKLEEDDRILLSNEFAFALDVPPFPEHSCPFQQLRIEAHRKIRRIQKQLH
jgi:hypothetical protein